MRLDLVRWLFVLVAIWISSHPIFASAEAIEFGRFYRIEKDGLVGHLVPSSHIGGSAKVRLSPALQLIIKQAGEVAFESFPSWSPQRQSGNTGAVVRTIMSQSKELRLEDELQPDVKKAVLEYLQRHEVPSSAWDAVQFYRVQFARDVLAYLPAIAGKSTQSQRAGGGQPSIDAIIYRLATDHKINIVELEGAPRAARAALAVSPEEANAEVAHFLRNRPGEKDLSIDEALKPLLEGEIERHYAEYRARECSSPILESACRKRTDSRNSFLSKKIMERVQLRTRPVAVLGALHLAGPDSVVAQLKTAGFDVVEVR